MREAQSQWAYASSRPLTWQGGYTKGFWRSSPKQSQHGSLMPILTKGANLHTKLFGAEPLRAEHGSLCLEPMARSRCTRDHDTAAFSCWTEHLGHFEYSPGHARSPGGSAKKISPARMNPGLARPDRAHRIPGARRAGIAVCRQAKASNLAGLRDGWQWSATAMATPNLFSPGIKDS
jgi:hypothetical protein